MSTRRVLIVSPSFHNYHSAFSQALESLGFEVVTHLYDEANSLPEKIRNRLAFSNQATVKTLVHNAVSESAINRFRIEKPDLVLVIKGDWLNQDWWAEVKSSAKPYVLWLYDELANMNVDLDFLRSLESVASYSRPDYEYLASEGVQVGFVPAGFDTFTKYQPNQLAAGKVSFIGARYSQREQLLRSLNYLGVSVKAFGREWSRNPWDVLRTRKFGTLPFESARDLSRSDSYGMMQGSLATINNHGSHKGLNFRTFEACGVGGVQFVDLVSVEEFYEPGSELLVYSSAEQIADELEKINRTPTIAKRIGEAAQKRTLAEHTVTHRMKDLAALWR
jgi:spore maturation protein CgeB